MQCEGETDDGGLKYSNTMPAQNSHTVCVHLYHLEHSRTAPRPPRDQPQTTPFPFAFGLPSPCRLQLKLENLCTNSLKQECLCVLYVLVSVPHMPFPSLPQLCLSPSPLTLPTPALSPPSVAFILSFCEHLACSFGFFWPTFGGHAQQSVMKFLGF